MEARQRLAELSRLKKQRDLTSAEWWETSALLAQVGKHDQAKQAAERARGGADPFVNAPAVAAPAAADTTMRDSAVGCMQFIVICMLLLGALRYCAATGESPEAVRRRELRETNWELQLRPIDAKVDAAILLGNGAVRSFWEINHVRVRLVWGSVLPELEAKELGMAALNVYLGELPRRTAVYVTVLSPNNLKLAEVHDTRL